MRTHLGGTVLAAFAATALMTAQAPSPGAPTPPGAGDTAPAYEQQIVTVEGCLRRERASDAAALELAADPDGNLAFVLTNAEVRSRVDTVGAGPGSAGTPAGPAELQNERVGVAVDGTGAAAGREHARNPSSPVEGSGTPAADRYVVVGLEDDRLRLLAGQRVALAGQFEPSVASVDPGAAPVGTSGAAERRPVNMPRFRATSVKPVPGICTPKP